MLSEKERSFNFFKELGYRYLALEDLVILPFKFVGHTKLFSGFCARISAFFSGCVIAVLADRRDYLDLVANSAFARKTHYFYVNFTDFVLKSYSYSLTMSMIALINSMGCDTNWESVKKGSWLLKKISHAR